MLCASRCTRIPCGLQRSFPLRHRYSATWVARTYNPTQENSRKSRFGCPVFLAHLSLACGLSIAKLSTLLEISHLTNLDRLLSFIVYPHMALAWRYVATSHEIGLCIVDCAEACMLRRTCRVSLPPSFKQFGRAVRITAYFELRVTWLQGIHIAYRWGVIVPCRSSRQARAAACETGTFQFT